MNDEYTPNEEEAAEEKHTGETQAPGSESPPTGAPESQAGDAAPEPGFEGASWDEVTRALEDFGHAVTSWAGALREDPETRRHARQLKEGFEHLGSELGVTLDAAAKSDIGKSVSEAAGRAGVAVSEVARKTGDQVAPMIVTALRGAAEGIQRAADGIEKRRTTDGGSEEAEGESVTAEAVAPEPPAAPEPPPAPESPPVPEPPSSE